MSNLNYPRPERDFKFEAGRIIQSWKDEGIEYVNWNPTTGRFYFGGGETWKMSVNDEKVITYLIYSLENGNKYDIQEQ